MVGATPSTSASTTIKRWPLALAAVAALTLGATAPDRQPFLLWNATASVPTGLYRIVARKPHRGALAVVRLPEPFRTFSHLRGYLPSSVLLVKPVAALPGDTLCRHGNIVTINGRFAALARTLDITGLPLPRWSGCRHLGVAGLGIIARNPDSLDSRYFGPLHRSTVLGLAIPVWTSAGPPIALTTGELRR